MDLHAAEEANRQYVATLRRAMGVGPARRLGLQVLFATVAMGTAYFGAVLLVSLIATGRLDAVLRRDVLIPSLLGFWVVDTLVIWGYRRVVARRRGRRVWAALRNTDSVAVAQLYNADLRRRFAGLADVDAVLAANRAGLRILYGEVAAARVDLAAIDWETRAPAVQASGLVDEALIALLCRGDAAGGLALAERARDMSRVRGRRSRKTRNLTRALVGLARVLADDADAETVSGLEKIARRPGSLTARFVAGRALYVAWHRAGDSARAETMRSSLERAVPYCTPLLADPDAPVGDDPLTRDPGPPSRAVLENAWSAGGPSPSLPGWGWRAIVLAVLLVLCVAMLVVLYRLLPP